MTTWLSIFGLVAGLASLGALRGEQRAATGAVVVGWIGLLAIGAGLHVGSAGTGGVPQWVPTWSLEGLAPMVAMVACAPAAVLPAIHGAETDASSAVCAGAWSIALSLLAGFWPESITLGAYNQGSLLIAAHAAAVVSALSVASAAALSAVSNGVGSHESQAVALAVRAVVMAWLAWPLAMLVHWRILGTPGVGSPAEWFAWGTVLFATGLVVASPSTSDARHADVVQRAMPVAVFVILSAAVGFAWFQGGWFGLSLPM